MQTKRKVCLLFIQTLLHRVVGKGMSRYGCILDWLIGKICMHNCLHMIHANAVLCCCNTKCILLAATVVYVYSTVGLPS